MTESPLIATAEPGLNLGGTLDPDGEEVDVLISVIDFDSDLWRPTAMDGELSTDRPGVVLARKAADDLDVGVGDDVVLRHPRREGVVDYQLVETELPRPEQPGIQRIDLTRHGVRLEPGREYEWTVALVIDRQSRSNDIVAAGWIDRIEPPAGLEAGQGVSGVRIYAEHGLWYDALAAVSDAIRADPADARLRASREAMLRQVGLGMTAAAPTD